MRTYTFWTSLFVTSFVFIENLQKWKQNQVTYYYDRKVSLWKLILFPMENILFEVLL